MRIFFFKYSRGVVGCLLVVIMLALSSCGTSKRATQKISKAEQWLENIEQVGAMDYAGAEYEDVQVRLEKARQYAERGRHRKAMLKADEAMLAAELAEVKTLSRKDEDSLAELKSSIESLKKQLAQYKEDQ